MPTIGPKIAIVDSELDGATYGDDVRHLFRMLQPLIQANVLSAALAVPPGAPANGATYIIATGGTGAWAGHDHAIAYWTTADPAVPAGKWEFYVPLKGWLCFDQNTAAFVYFDGVATWTPLISGGGGGVTLMDRFAAIPANNKIIAGGDSIGAVGKRDLALSGAAIFSNLNMVALVTPGGNFNGDSSKFALSSEILSTSLVRFYHFKFGVTHINITGNVLTVTVDTSSVIGRTIEKSMWITFVAMIGGSAFLNAIAGLQIQSVAYNPALATNTFTCNLVHADFDAADTGNVYISFSCGFSYTIIGSDS